MRHKRVARFIPGILATVTLLLGSGCASSAGPPDTSPDQRAVVTIGEPPFNATNIPDLVAEKIGSLKKNGVGLERVTISNPGNLVASLLSGSVDVTYGAPLFIAPAVLKGQPIRFFCGLSASTGGELVVPKTSTMKSEDELGSWKAVFKQFDGKKIGVPFIGPGNTLRFDAALKSVGADATFVAVGVGTTAVAALKKGRVDVLYGYPFDTTRLLGSGKYRVIQKLGNGFGPPSMAASRFTYGYIATEKWIRENTGLARSFCQAMAASYSKIEEDPSVLDTILTDKADLTPDELTVAKKQVRALGFSASIPKDKLLSTLVAAAKYDVIKKVPAYEDLVLIPKRRDR